MSSDSLKEVIRQCTEILAPVYGESAVYEARSLIAGYLSVSPSDVRLNADRIPVDANQIKGIYAWAARRLRREPLQYIAGTAYFMGEKFLVGKGVLIPRNDTEILVEEAISLAENDAGCRAPFLEFCTGSGCISISFIKRMQEKGYPVYGTATDISPAALSYAQKNAGLLGCNDRIRFIQHDVTGDCTLLKEAVPDCRLILANPPYIKTDVIPTLDPEVSCHEPHLALDGGADGLYFYRKILESANTILEPGGWILLEIGYDQENEILDLFHKDTGYETVYIKRDYGGNPRVAVAKKGIRHGR